MHGIFTTRNENKAQLGCLCKHFGLEFLARPDFLRFDFDVKQLDAPRAPCHALHHAMSVALYIYPGSNR